LAFPLARSRDDVDERRQANGLTGLVESLVALLTGSVGPLGDAIHNLSGCIDVKIDTNP
jgi:hypothetical protein